MLLFSTGRSIIGLRGAMDKKAFTLIELLVTIAIIGILVGLLTSAIRGAIDNANTLLCLNNMRQIYMGIEMYAQDHNSLMPGADMLGGSTYLRTRSLWDGLIGAGVTGLGFLVGSYIDDINVFYCKARGRTEFEQEYSGPDTFGQPGMYTASDYYYSVNSNSILDPTKMQDTLILNDMNKVNTSVGPHRKKYNKLYGDGSIKLEDDMW